MKILNLILYNENKYYSQMKEILEKHNKKYNIDFYFISYREDLIEDYYIDNHDIYIRGTETMIPGCLAKTIFCFELFVDKYDYIVRSNISTVINFDALKKYLNENKINYGGYVLYTTKTSKFYNVAEKHLNIEYVGGTSITLNNNVLKNIIKNKNKLDYEVIDDVSIGLLLNNMLVQPENIRKFVINHDIYNDDIIFYRNNSENRDEDIINMKNIINEDEDEDEDKDILKEYGITHFYTNINYDYLYDVMDKLFLLEKYCETNNNVNVLFFCAYSEKDFEILRAHNGKKYIFLNDCDIKKFKEYYYFIKKKHIDIDHFFVKSKKLLEELKKMKLSCIYFSKNINISMNYEIMGKQNKISIITLVRNNKHYLKTSMESLLKQTNNNWECIIINDGSRYEVEYSDFLSEYEKNKFGNKFKIINLKEWRGTIKCQKIGMLHSNYEIIGILDVDDMLHETCIDKVLNIYDNGKYNIFVCTNYYNCDSDLNIIDKGCSNYIKKNLLNDRNCVRFRTFRKYYYYLTDGYDDDLIFGAEDQDILWKIEVFCNLIILDECLYYYRKNIYSISILNKASRYCYYLAILKNIYKRFGNYNTYLKLDNGRKCLYSNDIFIQEINEDMNKDINTENKKNFPVEIKWNHAKNKFDISNVKLDIEKFRIITLNKYFDNIYVINLKKDINKRNRIKNIFKNYDFEFFEAICGIEEPHLSNYNNNNYNKTLRLPGAYGYSLTMIKIFEDALEKKYKKILVCDDDIILHNDFEKLFDKNIREIPFDWKVLFFGMMGPREFKNTFLENYDYEKPYITNFNTCDGSHCVGYDRELFQTIINETKKFKKPFDDQLVDCLTENKILSFSFYPYLVIQDTMSSTIRDVSENTNENYLNNYFLFKTNIDNYDLKSLIDNKYEKIKK